MDTNGSAGTGLYAQIAGADGAGCRGVRRRAVAAAPRVALLGAALGILLAAPAVAQVCPHTTVIYGAVACPAGATCTSTAGATLNYTQTDGNLANIAALCSVSAEDLPTACASGQVLVSDGDSLGCLTLPAAISGPVTSTVRGLAVWADGAGDTLAASAVTVGTTSERRLLWGNGAGLLESGNGLWVKSAGVDYAWEWSTSGHFCGWGTSNGPCLRMVGAASVPFTFTSDQDTGLGAAADNTATLYAGGVAALSATASTATLAAALRLTPIASAPTCDAGSEGSLYSDTSHALCWCDGTAWAKLAGAGACE